MAVRTNLVGQLNNIRVQEGNKATVAYLSIGVKNAYKNKGGEYEGKYSRTFYDVKFFATTDNQKKFLENTLRKVAEDKGIIAVDARIEPNVYEKDGKQQYGLQLIADNVAPYL